MSAGMFNTIRSCVSSGIGRYVQYGRSRVFSGVGKRVYNRSPCKFSHETKIFYLVAMFPLLGFLNVV
jgi:hypothetical protein